MENYVHVKMYIENNSVKISSESNKYTWTSHVAYPLESNFWAVCKPHRKAKFWGKTKRGRHSATQTLGQKANTGREKTME